MRTLIETLKIQQNSCASYSRGTKAFVRWVFKLYDLRFFDLSFHANDGGSDKKSICKL